MGKFIPPIGILIVTVLLIAFNPGFIAVGSIAGIILALISLAAGYDEEAKRNKPAKSIVTCVNCGYKCSSKKWSANAGCPNCDSDVYEGDMPE